MKVTNASFLTSLDRFKPFEGQGLPEIAFIGRSNVGKSSLINALSGRKGLAKTSAAPGKTRLINVFAIDENMLWVDLPGYGFARVSSKEREVWGDMIGDYLSSSANLRLALHLVDIRHEPSQEDVEMARWLKHYGKPHITVATKADKISRGARMKHIAIICRAMNVQPWEVVPFSSEDGTGKDALLSKIYAEVRS